MGPKRARRTKTTGPKGLQLEVGPRRGPRLLVEYNQRYMFLTATPASLKLEGSLSSVIPADPSISAKFAGIPFISLISYKKNMNANHIGC